MSESACPPSWYMLSKILWALLCDGVWVAWMVMHLQCGGMVEIREVRRRWMFSTD